MDVDIYPFWDYSKTMLVKWAPERTDYWKQNLQQSMWLGH